MAFIHDQNSPDQRNAEAVREGGLVKELAKTAISLVGYGIGLKVFRGLSFRANVGMGKLVAKLSTPNSQVNRTISRAVGQVAKKATRSEQMALGRITKFHRRLQLSARRAITRIDNSLGGAMEQHVAQSKYNPRMVARVEKKAKKSLTYGGIKGRNTSHLLTRESALKDIRFSTILQNTNRVKNSQFGKTLNKLKRDAAYTNAQGNPSIFGLLRGKVSGKYGSGNVARMIRGKTFAYGADLASFAAFDYAAYNLTMPSDKKWYNPSKIAEWGTFSIATDLGFRAAIPQAKALLKAAGSVPKRAVRGTLGDNANNFMHAMLQGAERISKSGTARAFKASLDNAELRGKEDNPGMTFIRNVRKFADDFHNYKHKFAGNHRKKNKSAYEEVLSDVEAQISQAEKNLGVQVKTNAAKAAAKIMQDDPNKWKDTVNNLFNTNIKSAREKVSVPGGKQNIFKGSGRVSLDGKEYDISNIMPGRIAHKAFNVVHDNFKVFGFPVMSILGLKPHLDSRTKKFALYTKENSGGGVVDIGLGYNADAIRGKLGIAEADINDFIRTSDDPALKEIGEQFERFNAGKLRNAKERSAFRQLQNQYKDAKNTEEFIDYIKDSRELMDEAVDGAAAKHLTMLEQGQLKLKKNEYVMYVGDQAYFGVKDGKKNKVFRLGYDAHIGDYHKLSQFRASEPGAGNLVRLIADRKHYKAKWEADAEGRMRRTGGGSSSSIVRSRVNPDSSPIAQIYQKGMDWLEAGSKTGMTFMGTAFSYLDKMYNPKTFRNTNNFIRSTDMVEGLMNQLEKTGDHKTFMSVLKSVSSKADVYMTNKFIKSNTFIQTVEAHAKSYMDRKGAKNTYGEMFDLFKSNDAFISEIKTQDGIWEDGVRNKAQKLLNTLNNGLDEAVQSPFMGNVHQVGQKNDIKFLKEMTSSKDISEFLAASNSGRTVNKDKFNSLVFRSFYKNMDNARKGELLNALQASSLQSGLKRNINLLNMSDIIDTMSNVDQYKISAEQRKLIGISTMKKLRSNKELTDIVEEIAEPIFSPSDLNSHILPGDPRFAPVNATVSLNKTDNGDKIYGTLEQITGNAKDDLGGARQFVPTLTNTLVSQTLNAVNNTGNLLGLGFNPDAAVSVGSFAKKVLFKRIMPAMAMAHAYNAADAFFDESGLFEGTQLGEGLTVLGASMVAQSRAAIAGVNDALGVTATAKYLEDVMPGSVNSPFAHTVRGVGGPLAGLAMGFKFGGPTGGLIGGSIGAVMSIMSSGGPMGMIGKFDITKSRAQLIEEYSGRYQTPVYKGSGWLFGMGPVEGMKIESFEPSWFHKIQSQYKYTDVLYGDKINRLLSPFDMDKYHEAHKYTRPYPVDERMFSDVPLIGNIIGLGGNLANEEELQMAAFATALDNPEQGNLSAVTNPTNFQVSGGPAGMPLPASPFADYDPMQSGGVGGQFGPAAVMPGSFIARTKAAAEQLTDLAGLRGFMVETAFKSMNDGMVPYEDVPVLESASWMTSPFRSFWDANLGDMMGMNEFIRRFIPKHGQTVNEINPLANTMPSWVANSNDLYDFGKGDPFTKVKRGEIRLPGQGYEAAHNVRFRFPLEAEYMGRTYEDQIAILTGNDLPVSPDDKYDRLLSGKIAQKVANQLTLSNANVKMGEAVFDPRLNMSGRADIVVNGSPVKTKAVSGKTFEMIRSAPRDRDISELNAILQMGGGRTGSIVYVNAETGESLDHQVMGDQNRYYRDIEQVVAAKSEAENLVSNYGPKIGINMANAYSRLDRLRILADVSPYSDEYQSALRHVRSQAAFGQLSPMEKQELETIVTQREQIMQRYITTDYKFNRGTAATAEEREYQDQVKAQYNFVERTLGSAWESFSHMRTPIHTKLLNNASPLEQYERMEVYGKAMRDWGTPYESFIRPYTTSALSKDSPMDGSLSWGMGGMIFGGPIGGVVGATAGGVYGLLNGTANLGAVPGYRARERDLTEQLDAIRYQKASNMYQATGSLEAKNEMERTMTYAYTQGSSIRSLYSALPRHEKPFIRMFSNMGSIEERQRLMQIAPDYLKPALNKSWNKTDIDEQNIAFLQQDTPGQEWKGWNANISTDDIAIKVFERACLTIDQTLFSWNNIHVKHDDVLRNNIMDGEGKMNVPVAIHDRDYDGEILEISLKGHYRKIKITPDHVLPIKKRSGNTIKGKRTWQEMKVEAIEKYDQLQVAGIHLDETCTELQLGECKSFRVTDLFGYFLGIFLAEGSFMKRTRNKSKDMAKHVLSSNRNKQRIINYIRDNGPNFPRKINEELGFKSGTASKYYSDLIEEGVLVKEGTTHVNSKLKLVEYKTMLVEAEQEEYLRGIQISLHSSEGWIADRIEQLCYSIGIPYVHRYAYKDKNAFNVSIHSEELANLINSLVGQYSHEKRLSDRILSFPINVIKNMIKGYFDGDGDGDVAIRNVFDNNAETTTRSVNTVSETLANHIWLLLRSFGINAHLYKYKYDENKKTNYRISFSDKKSIEIYESLTWHRVENTSLTVDEVTKNEYKGTVYDITMPHNHFYMVGPIVVHNSLDAHDIGLGWNEQVRRLRYTPGVPDTFTEAVDDGGQIANQVQNIVQSIVPNGQVTVVPTANKGISVTIAEQ